MKGEKFNAIHHPFDTQMNKAMTNAVTRRCPKNNMFAASNLSRQLASLAGKNTQGAGKYMSNIHGKLGMTISTQQKKKKRCGIQEKIRQEAD